MSELKESLEALKLALKTEDKDINYTNSEQIKQRMNLLKPFLPNYLKMS